MEVEAFFPTHEKMEKLGVRSNRRMDNHDAGTNRGFLGTRKQYSVPVCSLKSRISETLKVVCWTPQPRKANRGIYHEMVLEVPLGPRREIMTCCAYATYGVI